MSKELRLVDPIQWHEGMLLSPQHFQLLDARFETLLHFHFAAATPYRWGALRLELDESAFADGKIRVIKLEAVMPDGLPVRYRWSDERPLELDLKPDFEELAVNPQKVYLAVPAQQSGEGSAEGDPERFESIGGELINDVNTGGSPVRIPRLRPLLRLHLGKPSRQFTSFPLLGVACRGSVLAQDEFYPPTLAVAGDSALGRKCRDAAAQLRRKAQQIAESMNDTGSAGTPALLQSRLSLACLTGALPELEALTASGKAHPFAIYLALARVMGQTAALSKGKTPPALTPYNHDDLTASFTELMGYLDEVLGMRPLETFRAIPFKRDQNFYFLRVEKEWMESDLFLGVSIPPGSSLQDAQTWLESAVIGARSRLSSLKDRRVLGLEREPVSGESDLVPEQGTALFRLKTKSQWIVAGEDLILLPANLLALKHTPTKPTLYIKTV